MRVGSFCSGYDGLGLAVEAIWPDATTAWVSEVDPHASLVLEKRRPSIPNHGDLRTFGWSTAESVDLVTAGFPCQPVSQAGRRKAMADDRWLWDDLVRALGALDPPPRWVLLENVRGLLTAAGGRAMGCVVHDLAHLGYVGRYGLLSAAQVGAPHQRERVFVVAHLADAASQGPQGPEPAGRHVVPAGGPAADAERGFQRQRGPRPVVGPSGAAEVDGGQRQRGRDAVGRSGEAPAFGAYQPTIDRWAAIIGRPAPPGLHDGRLNERFVEWMMGLEPGWVTDLVPRRHALRILGNGVVPQQAEAAYRVLGGF